jgi:hypothetical protein
MSRNKNLKSEHVLLLALWLAVIGFMLLMVVAAWPQYWRFVAAETTPLTWLESVLLILTSFVTGLIAFLEAIAGKSARKVFLGWIALTAAFAWLSLDERFALHERVRDRFLKPTGMKLLPWMEAGDLLIPFYMLCGLAATWGIWKLIGSRRGARLFLVSGIILSAVAVSMDTIDIRSLNVGTERILQSVEEGLETLAMTSFLSAFLCVWVGKIRSLLPAVKEDSVRPGML